jgi:MFS transporter, CP family, cyanate transporter
MLGGEAGMVSKPALEAAVTNNGQQLELPPGAAGQAGVFLLVALNLRIAIAAVSPVLGDIQRDSGLTSSAAGLLTTIPIVCFGVFAFGTPRLTRRFGGNRVLLLAMLLLAGGIALYLQPSVPALFAATLVTGAAIAVGNVLLPGVIKRDFGSRAGLMTGLYSVALFAGAALAAGLTVPLGNTTGLGWRDVLALWAVPAVLAAAACAPRALRPGPRPAASGATAAPRLGALWRDPVAWAVTVFMGLQSLGYYALLAWLPTLFRDHHMAAGQAGWMLSFSSFPGMVAALATPAIERRLRHPQAAVAAAVLLCAIGYLGLLADPVPLSYLWMTALGLGQGATISLALGYIVARSPDHAHTGQLSTMAQGTGYLIACLGPLGLGLLHSATGSWTVPILALTAVLAVELIAGVLASRNRHVLVPRRLSGPDS